MATITGNNRPNNLTGTSARDVIRGLGANDTLSGLAGNDLLDGGTGNDVLLGGVGNDVLLGGTGNDRLDGSAGNDVMRGGAGNDTYLVNSTADRAIEAPGQGTDVMLSTVTFTLGANVENLTLTGAAGLGGRGNTLANVIIGNAGGNLLRGFANDDRLNGAGGADIVVGGTGNDLARGGTGDDRFVWNAGDGRDTADGDAGFDTAEANGGGAADTFNVVAAGARVHVQGVAPADLLLNLGTVELLVVNSGGGNDVISAASLPAGMQLTLNGGTGNDVLNGGGGEDTLNGGDGNDTVDGNGGNDTADLGNGNDTFKWDPGDGSDTVDGRDGTDTLEFNGADRAQEVFAASASGPRLLLTRDVGHIEMDADNVERIELNPLGGDDTATVNDLAGTEVTRVDINLGVNSAGDAAVDVVNVNGTAAADVIQAAALLGAAFQVTGLAAQVNVLNSEAANDTLVINGLGGNDTISGGAGLAAVIKLTLDGGDGNDTLNGGDGVDTLIGGDGNDVVDGNRGSDAVFLGAGNDRFLVDAGDTTNNTDTLDGGLGADTLEFTGNASLDLLTLRRVSGQLVLFRSGSGAVNMDDIETIALNTLGGPDFVTVDDLSAFDVRDVHIDLGVGGASDGAIDTVTINLASGNDVVGVSSDAGGVVTVTVNGGFKITIDHFALADDKLIIDANSGNDTVDARGLANIVQLTLNGGLGNDFLLGGAGNDAINGENGDDVMFGFAGDDTFTGGAGSDTAFGGVGTDTDGGGIEVFTQ